MSSIRIDVTANTTGAVTGLDQVRKATQRTGSAVDSASAALKRQSGQFNSTAVSTNKFAKGAMQQAGYQVGDFVVQVQGGTNWLQAFGQQGAQLAGIFGPIGAVIGAGIAIFASLAIVLQKATGSSKDLDDAMSGLSDSMGDYRGYLEKATADTKELAAEFGDFSDQIRGLSSFLADMKLTESMEKLQDVATKLKEPLADVQSAFDALKAANEAYQNSLDREVGEDKLVLARDAIALLNKDLVDTANELGLTADQAMKLSDHIDKIGEVDAGDLDGMARAAGDAAQFIQNMVDSGAQLPKELRDSAAAIGDLLETSSAALTEADGTAKLLKSSMDDVKTAISGASEEAKTLGDRLLYGAQTFMRVQLAARAARVKAAADAAKAGGVYGGRGGYQGAGATEFERGLLEQGGVDLLYPPDKSKSKSKSEIADPLKDLIARTQIQKELLGASKAEQAVRMAIYDADRKYTPEQIANAISLVAAYDQQQQAMDAIKDRTKQVSDAISSSMENAMMSMVDGTMSVKNAFKSMAAAIIKDLYRIFVVKKITGMITGAIEGYMNPTAPAIAGARAMGGPVTGGKAYMVGERGPEMIVPQRNGNVVPNNQVGGGGVTIIQNNTFGNGVSRAEIQGMLPKIVEASKAAVLDARRRGGSYAGAF